MRKYILILTISATFHSCLAQKTTKMDNTIIPEITKDFETFDTSIFKDDISRFDVQNEDGLIVYTRANIGFGKVTFFNNSYFKIVKSYYPNNKGIRKKGVMFNNGSAYGTWYEFNEDGKFVSEVNMDKGYNFGWKDILKYCDKQNIELKKGYIGRGGVPTEIYKTELEGDKVWQITYFDKKAEKIFQVILDGQNGELLNKKEVELIGG